MRRSLILDTSMRTVFHTILLFSLFLLFSGHDAPGGGFIGGLVGGAALVLRFVAGGTPELVRAVRAAPEPLLGLGLLSAGGTGAAAWLVGGEFLESGEIFGADVPVLGEVHVHSTLLFDVGVYLIVVGLVLAVLRTLGEEVER